MNIHFLRKSSVAVYGMGGLRQSNITVLRMCDGDKKAFYERCHCAFLTLCFCNNELEFHSWDFTQRKTAARKV